MFSALKPVLLVYKEQTEIELLNYVHQMNGPLQLKEICMYALEQGGKRFRPALLKMIADAVGQNRDVTKASIAVELFHTASLIADDLPCMDDADSRRGREATHRRYGESGAILATYAMIAEGYRLLAQNCEEFSKNSSSNTSDLTSLVITIASQTTGPAGATGGQYLDLTIEQGKESLVQQVIEMKTITLFELSLMIGWLLGGGDQERLHLVKDLAYQFGMAFQVADDLDDYEEDLARGNQVNLAVVLGKERAGNVIIECVKQYRKLLHQLDLENSPLNMLFS